MSTRIRLVVVIALAIACIVTGCTRQFTVRVEESGAPLTGAQAERLAAETDISPLASVSSNDAVAMRATVLSELRTRGALGIRAADLLTIGFPERTSAVPVLVRASSVDGASAVVVIEAFGSAGEMLVHRRLWVFDRTTGAVLRAASIR